MGEWNQWVSVWHAPCSKGRGMLTLIQPRSERTAYNASDVAGVAEAHRGLGESVASVLGAVTPDLKGVTPAESARILRGRLPGWQLVLAGITPRVRVAAK